MNIRKFTGPTSRDALRLVREALGGDAVVLSNHTLDDGSVEIVALADAELAALAPKAPVAAAGSMRALPPATRPASAVTGMPRAAAPNNPYASGGLPDVFSSVFGASAEPGAPDADDELLDDGELPAATVAAAPAQDQPAAPSAPAPWLVEHARRLTRQHELTESTKIH